MLLTSAFAATWTVQEDGQGDFSSLQDALSEAQSGDIIELGEGVFTGPFHVEQSLTIRGGTESVLSGDGTPLVVLDGGFLRLEQVTLENPGGVGITGWGVLELSEVLASGLGGAEGGVVALEWGTISLESCVFSDNTAWSGGHIALEEGSIVARDSHFSGGIADVGGAIWLGTGTLLVERSTVAYNNARMAGGLGLGFGNLTITDSIFQENEASSRGGGIWAGTESVLTIEDSYFAENRAKSGAGVAAETFTLVTVNESVFEANEAIARGGGLWVSYRGSLGVSNSTFAENSARFGYGGAILVDGDFFSSQNIFKVNFSFYIGGAVYAFSGVLEDSYSSWSDNSCVSGPGGAIRLEGSPGGKIEHSEFIQNNANAGAAIQANNVQSLTIRHTLFDDNISSGDGGALDLSSAPTTLGGCSFTENTAGGSGGAIHAAYSMLNINQCSFEDSEAGREGGALSVINESTTRIKNSSFAWSEADGDGGSIWLDAGGLDEASLELENVQITDSQAGAQGGAIGARYAESISLNRVEISRSTSEVFGGGFYAAECGAVEVRNTRFTGCESSFGGAVYSDRTVSDTDFWTNNIFDSNSARIGGAACFIQSATASIVNNTFIGNSATEAAGTLCLHQSGLDFRNNIVAWTSGASALYLYDATDREELAYNDWWENELGEPGGAWTELPGYHNAFINPRLVHWEADTDPTNDALQLATDSLLRDQGDPYLFDPDGSVSDMGAYGGPALYREDKDGDGFYSDHDCNDHNKNVYPGAAEIHYDGVDQDCDGGEDIDQDDDGEAAIAAGGTDCNDHNALVQECAEEQGCATGKGPLWLGIIGLLGQRWRKRALS